MWFLKAFEKPIRPSNPLKAGPGKPREQPRRPGDPESEYQVFYNLCFASRRLFFASGSDVFCSFGILVAFGFWRRLAFGGFWWLWQLLAAFGSWFSESAKGPAGPRDIGACFLVAGFIGR